MAQTVLLKRSSVAGNVPDSSDLSLGEIAVNTADGAVYIKKGNNDIVAVADNDILHIDTTNSRVGIGTTSPTGTFHVVGSNAIIDTADGSGLTINRPGNSAHMHLFPAYSSVPTIMGQGAGGLHLGYDSSTAGIRIDTSNNVGIGTTSPALQSGGTGIHVNGTSYSEIKFTNSTTGTASTDGTALVTVGTNFTINNRENGYFSLNTNNSERLRVDSSGNFLVGKTASDFTVAGHEMKPSSFAAFTRNGGSPLIVNRLSSDGAIIEFYKGTSSVGSIGTNSGQLFIGNEDGSTDTGLLFGESGTTARAIIPARADGSVVDGALDLGYSSGRFKDLHLSGTANVNSIKLDDTNIAYFGTGNDMQIQHTGAVGQIRNYTGNLNLITDGTDADIIFQTDDGSGGLAEYLKIDGGDAQIKVSKTLKLYDDVQAWLGNSNDFRI